MNAICKCIALVALLGAAAAATPPVDTAQLQVLLGSLSSNNIGALVALAPSLAAFAPSFASLAQAPSGKGLPPSAYIPADVLARLRSLGINPDAPSPSDENDDESNAPSPDLTPAQLQALLATIFGSNSGSAPPSPSPSSNSNSGSGSWSAFIPQGVIPQGVIPNTGRKMLAHQ